MLVDKDHGVFNINRYSPLIHEEIPDLKPGTIAYDDFWDEQDHRCLKGYKPKGMDKITGEHYFYLNMCKINMLHKGEKRKRSGSPIFRSLDRRLSFETEEAKENGYGLIVGKPRRVGLSWFGTKEVAYEMTFYVENEVGVCAGLQEKSNDFYDKVKYMMDKIRPEYRMGVIYRNDDEFKIGYRYRKNKQIVDEGALSSLSIKTMFASSSGFEGKSMSIVIFEEAGLFENLIASYKATEPCFKDGANQFGSPIVYGTGGEIEKGSKGYKEMWDQSSENPYESAFKLKKVFIPAYEYYPGDGIPDEKTGKTISFFDYKTGKTNQKAALDHILAERKRAAKSKEGIVKHIQSFPIKESEIFIKSKGGILDRMKLNTQLTRINEGECPYEYKIGRLDWVDDEKTTKLLSKCKSDKEKAKVRISRGSKVKFVEDPDGFIHKIADPINRDDMEYKPDIAGSDSYDEEADVEKNSLGATVVYRCFSGGLSDYDFPVCILAERGDSSDDDSFYENNIKMAVYWNYEVLIEYSKIALIKHFEDVGAGHYLKRKPELKEHHVKSRAQNEFGQRMDKYTKELVTKLLKSEVKNSSHNNWFAPLILDLIDYGDKNTDLSMAFGMALIFKLEMFSWISEGIEEDEEYLDPIDQMSYYYEEDGEIHIRTYGEMENDKMEDWNPEKHLSEKDKEDWKKNKDEQSKKVLKDQQEAFEKYNNDLMAIAIKDLYDK